MNSLPKGSGVCLQKHHAMRTTQDLNGGRNLFDVPPVVLEGELSAVNFVGCEAYFGVMGWGCPIFPPFDDEWSYPHINQTGWVKSSINPHHVRHYDRIGAFCAKVLDHNGSPIPIHNPDDQFRLIVKMLDGIHRWVCVSNDERGLETLLSKLKDKETRCRGCDYGSSPSTQSADPRHETILGLAAQSILRFGRPSNDPYEQVHDNDRTEPTHDVIWNLESHFGPRLFAAELSTTQLEDQRRRAA